LSTSPATLPLQIEWGGTVESGQQHWVWALGPSWVLATPLSLNDLVTLYTLGPHFCGPLTSTTSPPLHLARSFETPDVSVLCLLNPRTAQRVEKSGVWQLSCAVRVGDVVERDVSPHYETPSQLNFLTEKSRPSTAGIALTSTQHTQVDASTLSLQRNTCNLLNDVSVSGVINEYVLLTSDGAVECIMSTPLPLVFLSVTGVEFFFLLLERMLSVSDSSTSNRRTKCEPNTTQFALILRALVNLWTFSHPLISHLLSCGRVYEMLSVFLTQEARLLTPECVPFVLRLACVCLPLSTTVTSSLDFSTSTPTFDDNDNDPMPCLVSSSPAISHLLMGEELWRRTSHDVQESYWRYINQRLLALQNPHRQHNLHVLHQHRFLHFLLTTIDNAPRRVHSLITQTLSLLFDSISSSDLQVIQKKILTLLFGEVILSFVSFTDRSLSLSRVSLSL
jgi:hypothetical protein